jgi:hypothetical protein
MRTREQELQEVNDRWDFLEMVQNQLLPGFKPRISYDSSGTKHSVWVNGKDGKELCKWLNTVKPHNTESTVYFSEKIQSPFLVRITNPSHSSYQAALWIDVELAENIQGWFTINIQDIPQLIFSNELCKLELFKRAAIAPTETAMIHYLGMTRPEVQRMRVPGFTFCSKWNVKTFYSDAQTMNNTEETLHVIACMKDLTFWEL